MNFSINFRYEIYLKIRNSSVYFPIYRHKHNY
jgi:hypothetical protein